MKIALLSILFYSFISAGNAATTISCSHPELCRLAKIIFAEQSVNDYEFKNIVKIVGDPHEYEPSVAEIKNLISAKILIAGPGDLNPWIKKINYQRAKNPEIKTINLSITQKEAAAYPHTKTEALAHFWLYPKIFCSFKNQLEKELTQNKSKKDCLNEAQKISDELAKTLQTLSLPVVLTHDALLPLLTTLNKHSNLIVAIKGSSHHSEATPDSVKKLYDALKAPKVIWIEETGIKIPANILAKKRANDIVIKIDTAESSTDQYFQVLNSLNEKLKAIK